MDGEEKKVLVDPVDLAIVLIEISEALKIESIRVAALSDPQSFKRLKLAFDNLSEAVPSVEDYMSK